MSQVNAPESDQTPWMRSKKILVVDDEESISLVVEMSLRAEDYDVIRAGNGRDAIEKVHSETPDLIVMDVLMPVMDGFQALRILKEDTTTQDIPVIMLTAKSGEADILNGWLRGADMYMTKPFDPWALLANVNAIFQDSTEGDDEYFKHLD